jgi:hypothetical protein
MARINSPTIWSVTASGNSRYAHRAAIYLPHQIAISNTLPRAEDKAMA